MLVTQHLRVHCIPDDGEDPVYNVYPSVPSDDGMAIDDLKAATLQEIAIKGYLSMYPAPSVGLPPAEPTWDL